MIDLSRRHVLVVGGSRGIGAACARLAARAGARVSITYRQDRDAADRVGVNLAVQADVLDLGSIEGAVDTAVERLGPLHGLVVSAGIFEGSPLPEMTPEFWDRTIDVNLKGTFLAMKAAVPSMREKGGSIVIITSTAGQRGSAVYSAYATSKAGQIIFMRSMALELAPDNIRVNCVAPAWTDTDMAAASLDRLGRDRVAAEFALGRIGLAEDVAGPVCFLLSDLASFMTGSTVTVDGGMDMRG